MKHVALRYEDSITINGTEIDALSKYELEYDLKSTALYIHVLYDDEHKDFNEKLKTLFNKKGDVKFIHKREDRVINVYQGIITSIRKVFAFDMIESYIITIKTNT
jgi:hypothetical protein